MGNTPIVEGLIVKQYAGGDLLTIIHRDKLIAQLQALPVNAQGCIALTLQKRTFPDYQQGYTHTKPVAKIKAAR